MALHQYANQQQIPLVRNQPTARLSPLASPGRQPCAGGAVETERRNLRVKSSWARRTTKLGAASTIEKTETK